MSDDRDELIRERAHAIWEAEGSPHGRHDQHWQQAAAEVAQARTEAAQADEPVLAPSSDAPPAEPAPTTVKPAATRRPRKAAEATQPAVPAPKPRRKKGA